MTSRRGPSALTPAGPVRQIKGVAEYHVNADEPSVLDYNTDFKSAGQLVSLYPPDEVRMSDHEAVLMGLRLGLEQILLPLVARAANPPPPNMVLVPAGAFRMGCDPAHNGGYECYSEELPAGLP
jgi:hypothetical protein